MLKKSIFALTLFVLAAYGWAETVYIKDVVRVNLRSGKGLQYRILEADLPSGTKFNRVREEEDDGGKLWSFLQSDRGNEGWMESQYLQDELIARDRLAAAQRELAALRQQHQSSGGQISELELQNSRLSEQLLAAQGQINTLTTELGELKRISADAVNIDSQNQNLLKEREELRTKIDVLTNRNEQLQDDSNQTWFMYGAIAVGIGCLLTLIVQKVRIKRRYSEWA